jgi:hypothetical protein
VQHIEGQTMLCLAMLYLVKFHLLIFKCTCILNLTCWGVEHSILCLFLTKVTHHARLDAKDQVIIILSEVMVSQYLTNEYLGCTA